MPACLMRHYCGITNERDWPDSCNLNYYEVELPLWACPTSGIVGLVRGLGYLRIERLLRTKMNL